MSDSIREMQLEDIIVLSEKADAELKDKLSEYLQSKYGVHFINTGTISSPGDASVRLFFHPEEMPGINFTVKMWADGNIYDDYVKNLALDRLRSALLESIPGSAVSLTIPEDTDDLQETDVGTSLSEYLQKRGLHRILVRILINEDGKTEQNDIISVLEDASTHFNVDLPAGVWTLNEEQFELGSKLFSSFPSVPESIIDDLRPVSAFSVFIQNGSAQLIREISLRASGGME